MVRTVGFYDKVLGGISTSLVVAALVGLLTVVPLHFALAAGAFSAAWFIYLGVVRNPPRPDPGVTVATALWQGTLGVIVLVGLVAL